MKRLVEAIAKKLEQRKAEREAHVWAQRYNDTFMGRASPEDAQAVWEDLMLNYLCLYDTLSSQEEIIRHNVALQVMARRGLLSDENVSLILRAEQGIPIRPPVLPVTEGAEDVPRHE